MEAADIEGRAPLPRPFNVTWGVRLLWLYLVAGVRSVIDLFRVPTHSLAGANGTLVIALGFGFWTLPEILGQTTYQATIYLIQTALNVIAVALLFTPGANAWYRSLRRR